MGDSLHIEERGTEHAVVAESGTMVLDAERDYLVTGPAADLLFFERQLPSKVVDRFGVHCLRLRFGNAVGIFPIHPKLRLKVSSGKWGEAHFDDMLAQLSRVAAELPFAGQESSSLPYDRSIVSQYDVTYHAFVYLRHIILGAPSAHGLDTLPTALESIHRDPHRRIVREAVPVSPVRLRSVGAQTLREISRGTRITASGFHIHLDGKRVRIPEKLTQAMAREDTDNPENRFVKAFMEQCLAIVELVERSFSTRSRIVDDCHQMRIRLSNALRHSLWADVGRMTHVPVSSQVLQHRRGYRQVYQHFQRMRLSSRLPLTDDQTLDLLEIKDIAELYELWCYFRVVEALGKVIGPASIARTGFHATDKQVKLPWDYSVRWPSGVSLLYNLRFSRSKPSYRRSMSVPLRPDITLVVPTADGPRLHVFDAKFRLRRVAAVFSEDVEEEAASLESTFKRDDLYKMHTYRDALPNASSAWVLYPGDLFRFFGAGAEDGAVSCPADRGTALSGVGAVPLVPGEDDAELLEVLRVACAVVM